MTPPRIVSAHVSAGRREQPERDRQLLDGMQAARDPRILRRGRVGVADGVERREGAAERREAARPPAVQLRPRGDDRLDRGPRSVLREAEGRLGDALDRRPGPHRLGDGRGEDAGRFAAVARLVRARHGERLGVRAVGVAGVDDPDGRDVHRGAAVDDVPDAGLPRVRVAVPKLQHEPLLGEEQAVVEEILAVELGDPRLLVDDERHHEPFDVVGLEVVALLGVRSDEHAGHQRVVRDVPVALVERRERLLDPAARRIDSTTPSTQPPKWSWISCDSQPSVGPPSASPTAAAARQPTARSVEQVPVHVVSSSSAGSAIGRPVIPAGRSSPITGRASSRRRAPSRAPRA